MDFDYTKEPGRTRLERNLNTDDTPLVSIITPYYNAGQFFEQTFNCVMNQTFPWFEWIIVNDGSTKVEDVEILEQLVRRDIRIKVFHKENGGISTARNRAIQEASTDIIIPLDADDLIAPTYVEVLYWSLYYNPDRSWSYTRNVGFHNQQYLWDKPFDAELLKTYNFLVYSGAIRKADLLAVGGYDEITKHYYEDWRTWLKLLTAKKKPIKLGTYGFWYRRLDTGVLSIVNKDPEVQKFAQMLIDEVAATADATITAKEYPQKTNRKKWITPVVSGFEHKTFRSHDKLRVTMLLPWMEMGGADLFNLDVCQKINKEKFELSILSTVPAEQNWRQRFEECVTDIFDLPSFLDIKDYAQFISYFIKSREIDVLFVSNSYYGYYLIPWLRSQFPDLAIIDYVHMEEWYYRNGGYARTSCAMDDILEKTYVCNERTRNVMMQDFDRSGDHVETLYIGVDKAVYDANAVPSGTVREEYGITADRPIVLFPCRIHPQKRPFLMLEIAREAKKRIPDIAFIAAGDGPQLSELQDAVRQESLEGTVYLAGWQKDLRCYYKDSAVTLICSLKEGLSLTAYESLSMSTPVITSDVGGQAELIDDTVGRVLPLMQSEAAELDCRSFSQEEIRQYVDAIVEVLEDPFCYDKLCRNSRARVEEGFSTQIMIEKLERIFIDLVKNPEKKAKREEQAKVLSQYRHLILDYFTMYNMYEAAQAECEEVWSSREWFRNLYEQEQHKSSEIWEAREWYRTLYEAEKQQCKTHNPLQETLQLYADGHAGFRTILKYVKAWLIFKLFGAK